MQLDAKAWGYLVVALGVWIFWHHGGNSVTAAGVWGISIAVFGGYAAIWWTSRNSEVLPAALTTSIVMCFWTTLAMYGLFWRRSPQIGGVSSQASVSRRTVGIGVGITGFGLVASTFPGVPVNNFALGGLATLSLAIMLWFYRGRHAIRWIAGPLLLLLFYVNFVFDGYGRIQIVSLALVSIGVASAWSRRRAMKSLALLTLPVVGGMLVSLREDLGVRETGRRFDGIGSIVSPLATFADLLDLDHRSALPLGLGETFWSSAVSFVPRSLWTDKPIGFGAQLTELLEPELAGTGHSMAALAHGEFYYNFGPWGLVLMVPIIGSFVRLLDGQLVKYSQELTTQRDTLKYLLMWIATANLVSLAWVGTFTYVVRTMQQSIVVALILGMVSVAVRLTPAGRRDRPVGPPNRFAPPTRAAGASSGEGR